jgi:hypothetical protein
MTWSSKRWKGGRSDREHRGLRDCCEKLYADSGADSEDSARHVGACATRRCALVAAMPGRRKWKWKNMPDFIQVIGLNFLVEVVGFLFL